MTAKVQQLRKKDSRAGADADRFEILFENASDALMVASLATGQISSVNLQMQELTGYLRNELEGQDVDVLSWNEKKGASRSIEFSRSLLENSGYFEDVVIRGKDGHPKFVSVSVKTLNLSGEPVAMTIIRDVAEKKRMERELITKHTELRNAYVSLEKANADLKALQETLVQSGKLAALGELAAGIAHELNQPLTAIKGFAQEAQATLGTGDAQTVRPFIDEIVKGADKMQKIISHLRNFTRKSTEDYQMVNVHDVIGEALKMLETQFKNRGISVDLKFGQNVPQVYCNPFQLEQVFINFATNARDAIDAKKERAGRISISTEMVDSMVQIKFEDNGCGISEAIRNKIFNPFFTTKEVGKGMGLGLSISYGILARLNASVFVESAVGKGSTFTIRLPVDYRKL